jgi:N-acetylneuraminic acid mutarotase
MKKTILIVLVLTFGSIPISLAVEDTWTTKADMPTGRWELSTSVVDGKIYAIGGASFYQPLSTVEEYHPATDTWAKKSDMPTARQGLTTSVVDGKIYAIGGGDLSSGFSSVKTFSTVEEYDPAIDTWTTKSQMPTARGWHSASVLDGRIYVIGGSSADPSGGTAILAVEVYDPATDSWIQIGNIPRRIGAGCTSVVDGKIYAFGGYGGLNKVHEYDPVTDTWITKADMPTGRCGHSTSALYGKIYAIGGHPGSSPYPGLATVEVYNPATDAWTTGPDMIIGRCGVRTSVVDGKIYAFGGYMDTWLGPMCVTIEEYDPNPLVVDFNGDGIVDAADVRIMVDCWGMDEPSCDISPMPSGDGIVNIQDLVVLSEYFFKEINDPTLIAHWALDETEGIFAGDSVSESDAYIIGGATWQPDGGQVNGAIQLNGVDGCVVTGPILNPADGSFSILAWIKGGAPGQVVVSQQDAANWLKADTEGSLKTELIGIDRLASHLRSQTLITDGNWHRISFVWDGLSRKLYVDSILTAEDTQDSLKGSNSGLYLGCGKGMEAGTFFSGLIDDIRIYNRVVIP